MKNCNLTLLSLLALMLLSFDIWGQTQLFNETFGTGTSFPTGWTSSNSTNGWSCSTSSASNHSGASGGSNALFNGTGTNGSSHTLTYANNLSTIGYTSITVIWAGRRTASFSSTVTVQWSSDGSSWNNISYTDVTNNATWSLVNGGASITLPSGAEGVSNLRFRWTSTSTNSGNYRIDDIIVSGIVSAMGTSTISAGPGTEPTTISSLTNTQGASSLNFDIDILDDGSSPSTDALDTKITQMIFSQGTGNTVTSWSTVIAGAELSDGTNTLTGTINSTNITFSGINPATLGLVSDNSTKTYSLKVWLNTDMGVEKTTIDGKLLVFRIQQTNITVDNTGSSFATGQDQNSGSTNNAVSVVATALAFVQNASNTNKNASMSPSPTVSANDANGNRDLGFVTAISMTSTGTLQGSPVSSTPTSGLATFSSLIHTVSQTGRQLTASYSGLSSASSSTFDIVDATNPSDHFRSNVVSGSWATTSTWQSSTDGNDPWITATISPTSSASSISIRSGNTVTVSSSVTVDQVVIESGGILVHSGSTLTVNDGSGSDITIEDGGVLSLPTNSIYPTLSGSAQISIQSGGKITVGGTGTIQNLQGSGYVYGNSSILEYTNNNAFSASGQTYFPNADASTIPIFRVSGNPTGVGGGSATVINGILEVTGSIGWSSSGTKTFRNGIIGSGTVNQGTAGQFIVSGTASSIACTTTNLGSSGLLISGTVTLESDEALNGGTVTIASGGIINCGVYIISGTGFNLGAGAKIITAHSEGISSSGSSGCIQTTTRTFNSSANYEIQGGTIGAFTTTPVSNTVNNLTINSGGITELSQVLSVGGVLDLTSGMLNLNGSPLTVNTISNASSTNYIIADGIGSSLIKTNPSSFTFPVGTASFYMPCTLSGTGNAQVGLSASSGLTNADYALQYQWEINGFSSGISAATFSWSGGEGGSFPAGGEELYLFRYDGATWTQVGGPVTTSGTASFTNVPCCSGFTIGGLAALPVELGRFVAVPKQHVIELQWRTYSESNNSHFSIEKSADGKAFQAIGIEQGNGYSDQINDYDFTDEKPFNGLNYYRLRQVDFDGNFEYSKVVLVDFGYRNKIEVYPTIAYESIKIRLSNPSENGASVEVINSNGLLMKSAQIAPENSELDLDISGIPSGTYFIRIQNEQLIETLRFIRV